MLIITKKPIKLIFLLCNLLELNVYSRKLHNELFITIIGNNNPLRKYNNEYIEISNLFNKNILSH